MQSAGGGVFPLKRSGGDGFAVEAEAEGCGEDTLRCSQQQRLFPSEGLGRVVSSAVEVALKGCGEDTPNENHTSDWW